MQIRICRGSGSGGEGARVGRERVARAHAPPLVNDDAAEIAKRETDPSVVMPGQQDQLRTGEHSVVAQKREDRRARRRGVVNPLEVHEWRSPSSARRSSAAARRATGSGENEQTL